MRSNQKLSHYSSHFIQTGSTVPVIVPADVQPMLEYLADAEIREAVGISTQNKLLFAAPGNFHSDYISDS